MIKTRFLPLIALALCLPTLSAAEENKQPTNIGDLLDRVAPNLVDSKGKKLEGKDIKQKDYIVIYWSASWCGPCRKFTPLLVDYYNKNGGGDQFEVIFNSVDKSEEKMRAYMDKAGMKWPAIDFPQRRPTGTKAFAKGGIPRMMVVDKSGKILSSGSAYAGLAKLKELTGKK